MRELRQQAWPQLRGEMGQGLSGRRIRETRAEKLTVEGMAEGADGDCSDEERI